MYYIDIYKLVVKICKDIYMTEWKGAFEKI